MSNGWFSDEYRLITIAERIHVHVQPITYINITNERVQVDLQGSFEADSDYRHMYMLMCQDNVSSLQVKQFVLGRITHDWRNIIHSV